MCYVMLSSLFHVKQMVKCIIIAAERQGMCFIALVGQVFHVKRSIFNIHNIMLTFIA